MEKYTNIADIPKQLGLQRGDVLLISSDVRRLVFEAMSQGDSTDLNSFLEGFMDVVGTEGTILIPTYNWDFCKGKTFDYRTTPCKTGSLGKIALKRADFIRTKHPIYSFAVWGKDADRLYRMENTDSFGQDSPFAYLKEKGAKNLFIDVTYQNSFTYVHYVEEWEGNVPYRYCKDFTAGYIDEQGMESVRTYSMFVRDLDRDVQVTIDPMESVFAEDQAVKQYTINDIPFRMLDLGKAYQLIREDIVNNKSRRLCSYIGQDE